MAQQVVEVAEPVIVDYETQLKDLTVDLSPQIETAFGLSGLGLIVIKGVPHFPSLRQNLLPLIAQFADLPDSVKAKYEHEKSHYSFGWSHGKEKLKPGVPDYFKGSYYNNPTYDVPTTDTSRIEAAPELCSPNIWPNEDCPQFAEAFKALGRLIVDVGILLAHHCDNYIIKKLGDKYKKENHMVEIIKNSRSSKARLLHYFEVPQSATNAAEASSDDWCGWHNDHCSLTGLCSAMFRDVRSGEFVNSPDPEAGLYCRPRTGGMKRVKIPADCLAFQIGECSQILTGGLFRATPHAVKAINPPNSAFFSRETFAVFMQPDFDHILSPPPGHSIQDVAVGQYKEVTNFAGFSKATIEYYYGA